MDLGLEGKSVVITGGTRGIGLAAASAFLGEGASVVVAARKEEELRATEEKLSGKGRILTFRFDALDSSSFYSLADYAASMLGTIDVWVNNVGASHPKSAGEEYTEDDLQWTEAMCFESAVHGVISGTVRRWGRKRTSPNRHGRWPDDGKRRLPSPAPCGRKGRGRTYRRFPA